MDSEFTMLNALENWMDGSPVAARQRKLLPRHLGKRTVSTRPLRDSWYVDIARACLPFRSPLQRDRERRARGMNGSDRPRS